jgi:hypothetical protein
MTSHLDIYRAAKLIIDQHGAEAVLYAAHRADLLLGEGDGLGSATWRRLSATLVIRRLRADDQRSRKYCNSTSQKAHLPRFVQCNGRPFR